MKKYRKLKAKMMEQGIEQTDLADHIGRSRSYVDNCLNGKNRGFRTVEVNRIMSLLDIDYTEYGKYFRNSERRGH